MIDKIAYAVIVLVAMAGLVWMYGESKEAYGYSEGLAAFAQTASDSQKRLLIAKNESAAALAELHSTLKNKEDAYHAEIKRLTLQDDSYRKWRELTVHPTAVSNYQRMREQAGASTGGVPR